MGAAAVRTRHGITGFDARTSPRVVTTGCGQSSVFGDLMGDVGRVVLQHGHVTGVRLRAVA